MQPRASLSVVFLALFGSAIALAQAGIPLPSLSSDQIHSIDSFIGAELTRQRIPGIALGVYSRGRILLAKGYGKANLEHNVPVSAETIFQSGSVGKQFVSAAIMMLVEEGKVSLDDSVAKYFPNAPDSWKPVQIRNLLSHTSGLSEYETRERIAPGVPFYLRLDFTEEELVTKIEALPIEWAPGEKWAYRNTNYLLLGVLIHKVAGKGYADFLAERIFQPLGMVSTRLISDRDIIPNRAAGYEIDSHGDLKNQDWVSPTFNSTADGTLYFNVLDVAKWDGALYGTRLLKQSSLDRMWTVYPLNNGQPNPSGYGFGWNIGQQNNHKRIEHGGAWQGFTCEISRYPDDNLTVVVLTNLDAGHANTAVISHVVAGLSLGALMPDKLKAIPDTSPAIADRLRKLLSQLVSGDDVQAEVTPQLAGFLTPEARRSGVARLSKIWPGGTITLVKRQAPATPGGVEVSTYRVTKGAEALLIPFGINAEGKISVLGLAADREFDQ